MAYGTIKVDTLVSTSGTVDLTTVTTSDATTSASGYMSAADKTKLDGIEASATADQTGAEIKAAYEGEADTNAFTDADHTKLDGIEAGAQVNTVTSVNGQTGAVTVSGSTDLSYTASTRELASSTGTNTTLPEVVAAGDSGLMTGADKTKLDGIAAGAEVNTVDSVAGKTGVVTLAAGDLTDVDTTGVSNGMLLTYNSTDSAFKPITPQTLAGEIEAGDIYDIEPGWNTSLQHHEVLTWDNNDEVWLNKFVDYGDVTNTPSLATVATSGAYGDLSGTPTVPTNNNQLTNGAGYITDELIQGNALTWAFEAGSTHRGQIVANSDDTLDINLGSSDTNVATFGLTETTFSNNIHINGEIITGSSASLQVNGFQRTGTIYLHPGDAPAGGSTGIELENVSGDFVVNADILPTGNVQVEADQYFGTLNSSGTESEFCVRFGQPSEFTASSSPGKHLVIGNAATWNDLNSAGEYIGDVGVVIGWDIDGWSYSQTSIDNVIIGREVAGASTSNLAYNQYSVIIGSEASRNMRGQTGNVCVGYQAGYGESFTSGGYNSQTYTPSAANYNVFIGREAGKAICRGDNNIAIGWQAGTNSSPSGRLRNNSNVVVLGNNSISNFYCADTSISSSDARDKTDVEDFTAGLSFIEALRPVTYRWDKRAWYLPEGEDVDPDLSIMDMIPDGTHKREKLHIGFLAQELEAVEQAHGFANTKEDQLIVNLNEDDTAYGVKYERLVPVLVNAIKELKAEIDELKSQLS